MPTRLLARLCTPLWALTRVWLGLALCLAMPALALPARQLDDTQPSLSAWPSITHLAEGAAGLGLAEVMRRRVDFVPPTGPTANLGVRREAVWLLLPLQLGRGDDRRVLDIDFPLLKQVDLHLVQHGRVLSSTRLGNGMPFNQRPLPTRAHAVALELQPGQARPVSYTCVSAPTA